MMASRLGVAALLVLGAAAGISPARAADPPPAITSVQPGSGTTAGQQLVYVHGTGFGGEQSVTFGTVTSPYVHVIDSTVLRTTAPAQAAGLVTVRVHTSHGTSPATNGAHFRYLTPTLGLLARDNAPDDAASAPACPAIDSCVRVGRSGTSLIARTMHDGVSSSVTFAPPAGAQGANLGSVSCISISRCTAIGSFTEHGVTRGLLARLAGGRWHTRSMPLPDDAGTVVGEDLASVSCGSTDCVAVGSYSGSGRGSHAAIIRVAASSMTFVDTPAVAGTDVSELSLISCTGTDFCGALGSYSISPSDPSYRAVGLSIVGGTITTQSIGALTSDFYGSYGVHSLDCAASGRCNGVGEFVDLYTDGFAVTLYHGGWSVHHLTLPPDAVQNPLQTITTFFSVSCASADSCVAVGSYARDERNPHQAPLIARHEDGAWQVIVGPGPRGAVAHRLSAVSCSTRYSCLAVGSYSLRTGRQLLLFDELSHGMWSARGLTAPRPSGATGTSAGLDTVACPAVTDCVATGSYGIENDAGSAGVVATEMP